MQSKLNRLHLGRKRVCIYVLHPDSNWIGGGASFLPAIFSLCATSLISSSPKLSDFPWNLQQWFLESWKFISGARFSINFYYREER